MKQELFNWNFWTNYLCKRPVHLSVSAITQTTLAERIKKQNLSQLWTQNLKRLLKAQNTDIYLTNHQNVLMMTYTKHPVSLAEWWTQNAVFSICINLSQIIIKQTTVKCCTMYILLSEIFLAALRERLQHLLCSIKFNDNNI